MCKCNICQNKVSKSIEIKNIWPHSKDLWFCKGCNLHLLGKMPTQKELNFVYDKDDYTKSKSVLKFFKNLVRKKRVDSQIDYIDSFIQTDEMIVYEIGAGDGLLLNRVKAKKKYGSDYNSINRINSKKNFNLRLFKNDFPKYQQNKNKFDFLLCSHVYEHLIDYEVFFKKIKKNFNKNHFIFIEVPNTPDKSFNEYESFFQTEHTYNHSLKSLKKSIEKYGYKIIDISNWTYNVKQKKQKQKTINFHNSLMKGEINSDILLTILSFIKIFIFGKNLFKRKKLKNYTGIGECLRLIASKN